MKNIKKLKYLILLLSLICCNSKPKERKTIVTEKSNLKIEKSVMIKPKKIGLSKDILKKISIPDIIYAEVAEGGAMGNVGGIIIYIIEDKQLISYETSLFTNEDMYIESRALLLKHQDGFKYDDIKEDEILFDYHYGGMGNHVFINKNISLKENENFFLYELDHNNYQIFCSVQGVFNLVVYSIKNSQK